MAESDEDIYVAVIAKETSRQRSRRAVAIEHGVDNLACPVAVEQDSGDEAGGALAVQDLERELDVSSLVEEGLGDQPRPPLGVGEHQAGRHGLGCWSLVFERGGIPGRRILLVIQGCHIWKVQVPSLATRDVFLSNLMKCWHGFRPWVRDGHGIERNLPAGA